MTTDKYEITFYNCTGNKYESIEVSKDVYDEYRRDQWRMDKEDLKHSSNEIPFSALVGSEEDLDNFREFAFDEVFDEEDTENERLKLAIQALDMLSDKMRERYILHYLNGVTTKDIAESENVSEYSVKESLRLAQKKINIFLKNFRK